MKISGILQGQTRILDDGRSGFQFCPRPGKVTACKGVKNLYEVDRGLTQAYIVGVLTFPASGVMCSLMLVYSCKRVAYEIIKRVPDDVGVGHSPAGWMTVEVFCEYVGNVFTPHPGKYNVKFGIALYIDGHCIHLTYQLSKLHSVLAIILISLSTPKLNKTLPITRCCSFGKQWS
jgi:DDE superfamily endonuclease.